MRFPLRKALKSPAPRMLAALMLALALLSGLAPFSASSSSLSHPCAMACCAGKPPHEAGTCASAIACHLNPSTVKEGLESRTVDETSDGAMAQHQHHHEMMSVPEAAHHKEHHPAPADDARNGSRQGAIVAVSVLSSGCRQDCGAGVFSSSGESRQRDPASLAYAVQPRPPCRSRLTLSGRNLASALDMLRGKLIPRAPPALFS